MHLIFAQSLGEYGALSSLASGVQQLTYSISTWLGNLSTTEWIIAVVVVVGLFFLTRR
jgi:ABC-type molybdate transport system permease subunit